MHKLNLKFFRMLLFGVTAMVALSCQRREVGGNNRDTSESTEISDPFPQKNSTTVVQEGTPNLVSAAKLVTSGVVHVKTLYRNSADANSLLGELYGQESAPNFGSGSGVVISPDGYIATNNHVIENASEIQVVMHDRRAFTAK